MKEMEKNKREIQIEKAVDSEIIIHNSKIPTKIDIKSAENLRIVFVKKESIIKKIWKKIKNNPGKK